MGATSATSLVLRCHNCGAPLRAVPGQRLVACIYCYASSAVTSVDAESRPAAMEPSPLATPPIPTTPGLSPEAVRDIFELLHSGQRERAAQRCIEELRCSPAVAEETLRPLAQQVTSTVLRTQRAGASGVMTMTLALALAVGSVVEWAHGVLPAAVAVIVVIVAGAYLLLVFRLFVNLVRFSMGRRATATVRKLAVIGPLGSGRAVRAWLAVQMPDGRTFDAESDLVVVPESLWKLAEGVSLQVRCLGGDEVTVDRLTATRPGAG